MSKQINLNGREAHVMRDGSGFVAAKRGDHPWQIAKDILKFHGHEQPLANEVLCLFKELTWLNGSDWVYLSEGRVVDFPARAVNAASRELPGFAQNTCSVA